MPAQERASPRAGRRLIVLRGPSAAGKSTVATELARACAEKVAVLEEDYFRRIILRRQDEDRIACKRMLQASALAALDSGFHVILDGILNARHYREMIEDLADRNRGRTFLYYFDVSFEESLRRHETKPIAAEVSPSTLRDWYGAATLLGDRAEMIIPETCTLQQAVRFIQQTSGLVLAVVAMRAGLMRAV